MWKLDLACQQILDQCKCFFKVPRSHEFLKFNLAGVCEKLVHWAVQQHTLACSLEKTPLCFEEHTTFTFTAVYSMDTMHSRWFQNAWNRTKLTERNTIPHNAMYWSSIFSVTNWFDGLKIRHFYKIWIDKHFHLLFFFIYSYHIWPWTTKPVMRGNFLRDLYVIWKLNK